MEQKRFNLANGELRRCWEMWQDQLAMRIPLPGSHCFGPAVGCRDLGMGQDFMPDFRGSPFVPSSE